MNNIYWVGTRQSDIEDTGDFFAGSITIFGDNKNGNISYSANKKRINQNFENEDCNSFFIKTLEEICQKDENAKFIFYNPIEAYGYGETIIQHTLCLNSIDLLHRLSNKQRSRFIINELINSVPFIILRGADCSYSNICNYFRKNDEFVIQLINSSGGEGTFHIDSNTKIDFLNSNEEYLISPYIKDSISINTHIIVFDDDIQYFPSSIQITTEIEHKILYCGADYICFNTLSQAVKADVNHNIKKIGEFIQQSGYRGIIGIDFLLDKKQLYFIEFNTRFQASSQLINKTMFSLHKTSLQKINLQAFENAAIPNIKPFEVKYSNYVYTTNNISKERLKRISFSKEVLQIQTDGFEINERCSNDKNVYLKRFIFDCNICSINNSKLILHPNIFVEDIKPLLSHKNPYFKQNTKIALLNHGVSLSNSAIELSIKYGEIKEAVFDAIDAIIFKNVNVNIPRNCKFNTLSPFVIDVIDNNFVLLFDGCKISDINIYFMPNSLLNKYTKSGVPYDAIINLATDRIRINPAPVCYYKQHGLACKFCNLPDYNMPYTIIDIKEVIDYCLDNVEFEHFLIGGGTYSTDKNGWNIISEIACYIREKSDKKIYLMSIPPESNSTIDMLKEAGITEVAFNLEMFDREMAKDYMPGKGNIDMQQYISSLTHSVSLWGNTGCVRSLLIYGFDSDELFVEGVDMLCKIGVEPIISIFRPLNGTAFSHMNPPPTKDIISIYDKCSKIAANYSLILGPDCPKCQNNTLSFTEII